MEENLFIPANALDILKQLKNISFFNLLKHPLIKLWLKTYIFTNKTLFKLISDLGEISIALLILFLVIALCLLTIKFIKKVEGAVEAIKRKMMYSSLLRSQI